MVQKRQREGFSFVMGGFPLYEGYGGFGEGKDTGFYNNPLFPRYSVVHERQEDVDNAVRINNYVFWGGSAALVALLAASLVLVARGSGSRASSYTP
jgi:hypothetical protein